MRKISTDKHYQPPKSDLWSGRDDGPENPRFFQTTKLIDLKAASPSAGTVLLGFCCDEGVKRNLGRQGAADGPGAFRRALAKLPSSGILVDCGDITCIGEDLEGCQKGFSDIVATLPKETVILGIGGGHEIAWAHYQGLKQKHKETIGIINIDAHYDLRPLIDDKQGSSGTSFLQIADSYPFDYTVIGIQKTGNTKGLFQIAKDHHVTTITAEEIHLNGLASAIQAIDEALFRNDKIYLSICLDVFAAPYAPGVSAPQPLGLTPWQVIPLLKRVCASKKVVGIDIAELNPKLDRDGVTAVLAAAVASTVVAG